LSNGNEEAGWNEFGEEWGLLSEKGGDEVIDVEGEAWSRNKSLRCFDFNREGEHDEMNPTYQMKKTDPMWSCEEDPA
jgi:hypothetical protein